MADRSRNRSAFQVLAWKLWASRRPGCVGFVKTRRRMNRHVRRRFESAFSNTFKRVTGDFPRAYRTGANASEVKTPCPASDAA